MSAFELLTAAIFGLGAGVAVAAVWRWRSLGGVRVFVGGALGGLIGGLIGYAACAVDGPTWGELEFHPALIAWSLVAGGGVVALLHLLGDAPVRRQTVKARRPRG